MEESMKQHRIDQLNELIRIQGEPGNIDQGEYMRGLYNGLELAAATLEGREPVFKTFEDVRNIEGDPS